MFFQPRLNAPLRSRIVAVLPWVFVIGVAVGTMLPLRAWLHLPPAPGSTRVWPDSANEILRDRTADPAARMPVEVLRTIDGDTFV
ncbi:hypothetical protein, partial [Klebsiella pneumoniae]|uniref:hypothetical protein n=1 Tax=Klebsiella pneumoniae TaxID=573 RepID=UPI00370FD858